MSCDMWFGTQDYATWIQTPQRGADVSAHGWNENGTFLNGGAFAFNSYNTHKEFDFSWRTTSSRKDAQTMMSFYSGTFGRGKLYFIDPLTMETNVLPARWADPSITCDFEGESLVPGIDPLRVGQTNTDRLQLPVTAAQYDLSGITEVETSFNVEATNLFTNPNLVGDGTWAEVRRNHCINPSFESDTVGWTAAVGASLTRITGPNAIYTGTAGAQIEALAGATNVNVQLHSRVSGVEPGDFITTRQSMRRGTTGVYQTVAVGVNWLNSSGSYISAQYSAYRPIGSGAASLPENRFSETFGPAPADAASANVIYRWRDSNGTSPAPAGSLVHMDGVVFAVGKTEEISVTAAGEYLDGSTMDGTMVQPEDFRVRWLGEPNESESVMEIERVVRFVEVGAIPGVSSFKGKPAVRVISTGTSGAPRVAFPVPIPMRELPRTLVGTLHVVDPTRTGGNVANPSLGFNSPVENSPAMPGVGPGSYPLRRFTSAEMTPQYQAHLYALGYRDSGDVWWTDIGLYAGDYEGEAFSGDSEVPGKVTRWAGTPNASPSELGYLTLSTSSVISESNALFVPLPDGMQLNVGAFYQSTTTGQGVYVTPATRGGGNTGVVTRLTPLTPSTADTLPDTFTKTPGVIGVWVWIGKTAQGPGVVTVNAIHARVTPLGSTSTGEAHWYGGQGNEGVRFLQPPTYINNTGRDGGQIEFAATFTEVSF